MTAPLHSSLDAIEPEPEPVVEVCSHCSQPFPSDELLRFGGDEMCRTDFLVAYAQRGAELIAHPQAVTEEEIREMDAMEVDFKDVCRDVFEQIRWRLTP